VPDAEAERRRLGDAVARGLGGILRRLGHERRALGELTARPVMRGRGSVLAGHRETLAALRATARRRLVSRLDRERAELTALHRHGRSLSPSTVLDRGFALVQHGDGRLVLGPDEVGVDELLRIRVARGIIAARALAPGTAGSAGLDR
ncbi:MAG TPA: exodeoxyribonuclease VII large subunit, partial [Dermatophilaceae bacterium]|nr:exodeoxyribonuclease VII large subunit [Dermatophilaceae bacterium]